MTNKNMKQLDLGQTGRYAAAHIARERLQRGLSYAELSRRLADAGHHLPPLALRRIEAYARRVDVDDLTALAIIFEVSPNALIKPIEDLDGFAADGVTGASGVNAIDVNLWLDGVILSLTRANREEYWQRKETALTNMVEQFLRDDVSEIREIILKDTYDELALAKHQLMQLRLEHSGPLT